MLLSMANKTKLPDAYTAQMIKSINDILTSLCYLLETAHYHRIAKIHIENRMMSPVSIPIFLGGQRNLNASLVRLCTPHGVYLCIIQMKSLINFYISPSETRLE